MAALLNSGLTLSQSLNLAGKDCSKSFRRYLQQLSLLVGNGDDWATAINLNVAYFDAWTVSLISLAEHSGCLPQMCLQLAANFETQLRHKRLYDSLRLSIIAIVWSLLILTAVIFNRTPMGFVRPEFWLRSLAIAFLLLLINVLAGRYLCRGSILLKKLPVVGRLRQTLSLTDFAQLRLPLSCGLPILAAVELLKEHIPDVVMKANLSSAARQIRLGQSLGHSLEGKLPPIALQMIHTGETTGNLETAMANINQYYGNDLAKTAEAPH